MEITIIEYEPSYALQTVRMWRDSKVKAIGQKETSSFEDHVFYLNNILVKDNKVFIAIDASMEQVVGILAWLVYW